MLYTIGFPKRFVVVDNTLSSSLWRKRLRHMNKNGMKMLVSIGYLHGLKYVHLGLCECCVLKNHKRAYSIKVYRELKVELLEIEHTNMRGPFPDFSLGSSRYYFTFIDDFSRKV